MRGLLKYRNPFVFCIAGLFLCAPGQSFAQATLLLEEPYSYDGTFAGTGHAAIYLSRVCADSPAVLRRCHAGENGVVLSRYHNVAGRDWMAIPLIPYLYAVERADNIPLFVDPRLVALLRERYLSTLPLPAEAKSGSEPRYELAGSAYDRTLYGFRFATTPEQDDRLIQLLNSSPNHERYQLVKRNCADFVKEIVNFYYPHAIHRAIIADVGVTTPKQAAKSLVHYSKRHPEMQLTTFLIPQVPGLKPSKPVHGVIESLVLAKKYVTPVLLFHPAVVATVEGAYWAGWRFNPGKGALIFNPASGELNWGLEKPLTATQRRSYQNQLEAARKREAENEALPHWRKLETTSQVTVDAQGRPVLVVSLEGREFPVGLCRANTLRVSGSPELIEDLLLARLQSELKPKNPIRASEPQVNADWKLLEAAREASRAALATR
ncbi:MAG TPA: hypothetical protein VF133_06515 [Terriglobales bacterium]